MSNRFTLEFIAALREDVAAGLTRRQIAEKRGIPYKRVQNGCYRLGLSPRDDLRAYRQIPRNARGGDLIQIAAWPERMRFEDAVTCDGGKFHRIDVGQSSYMGNASALCASHRWAGI